MISQMYGAEKNLISFSDKKDTIVPSIHWLEQLQCFAVLPSCSQV